MVSAYISLIDLVKIHDLFYYLQMMNNDMALFDHLKIA